MRWFVRSDVDGFFGLALDNLVQLLLIDTLCRFVLGLDAALVRNHILPGTAVAVLIGNIFYARQAVQIGRAENRNDMCALPYGVNTVSVFAFVFLVMLPAKLTAQAMGVADPGRVAFRAGLMACFGSGLIELFGAFVAEKLRKITPRAALLSTLAGIALGFISLGFLFRTFARPIVGLSTLAVVLLTYFGKVKFKGRLPGGLVAIALGTLLAWQTGLAPGPVKPDPVSLTLPIPLFGDLVAAFKSGDLLTYAGVIVPMGLFNVLGSLQNIESAEAAGDTYPTAPSLSANGIGTIVGALFGSCFPTTIYIGHPGWKAMGARAGYSVLNGLFITLICLTGTIAHIAWAVPIDAGMAIVLWIGIVISAQAFQATPKDHAPAVVVGLLPGLGAWGVLLAKNGLRAAGFGSPGGPPFESSIVGKFHLTETWIDGGFALEQGFIFSSMLLAAATVEVIERRFLRAAAWCAACALLSAGGLMHAYDYTPGDTRLVLRPAFQFVIAYTIMAVIFAAAKWVTVPDESGGH
ncbi:MAG: NCS2 family permease [Polyangiaceae bacterium]|nr:NCS2 family permease [Polyangiaceae bacterium]